MTIKNQVNEEQNPSGLRSESPLTVQESSFNEVEIFVNGESVAKASGQSPSLELLGGLVDELQRRNQ